MERTEGLIRMTKAHLRWQLGTIQGLPPEVRRRAEDVLGQRLRQRLIDEGVLLRARRERPLKGLGLQELIEKLDGDRE